MHLHDLRSHGVVKFFAYIGFGLIIISFVVFYGWNPQKMRDAERGATAYAKMRSDDPLSFLPWRKWENIGGGEVKLGRDLVKNERLGLLDPQIVQFMQRQGRGFDWVVNDEDGIRKAVDLRILRREAQRQGLLVTDDETLKHIRSIWGTDAERLNQYLQNRGISEEQYLREIRDEEVAFRAQNAVANQARVSLFELWQEYVLISEKIKLKIASYPAAEMAKNLKVTDDELQSYLTEHQDEYRIPTKRRYAYVKMTREEIAKSLTPTPEQIQSFFDQNAAQFTRKDSVKIEDIFAPVSADQPTTAAMALMDKVQKEAVGSASWNDLALKMEKDNPGSMILYRDRGWIERDDKNRKNFGPIYLDRAFALADDVVSTPVQSLMGVHVIRPKGHRSAGLPTLDEIRQQVEEKFREQESAKLLREKFLKLREEIRNYPTLHDFAVGVGMKDELTTTVAVSSPFIPEIGSLAEVSTYVRNLKPGQLSELIPLPSKSPTMFCALQISQEDPSYVPKLEEVRSGIETAIRKKKGIELAKSAAEAALEKAKGSGDFDAAISDAPGKKIETKPFTRLDPENIIGTALGAPLVGFEKQTAKISQGSLGVSSFGGGRAKEAPEGYAIWKVLSLEPPSKDEFRKERRTFESDMLGITQRTVVEEWLADRRREVGYEKLSNSRSTPSAGAEAPDEE